VTDGTALAVRVREGVGRPIVLVHGLASNALLWRDVAERLAERGHAVAAVDLRGHGRSDRPESGYTTAQAASDVSDVVHRLGWEERRPVVAGQSWGGNVAVRALARQDGWGGLLCVDGGWIDLSERFPSFEECWSVLAPPGFGDASPDEVVAMLSGHLQGWPHHSLEAVAGNLEPVNGRVRNRLTIERHRSIVHSLWSDSPFADHPAITAPAHLMVAGRTSSPDVDRALALLPDGTVSWHPSSHHDLHLQHPELVLDQMSALLDRVAGSGT
jgi:pimeloyl-ACP methyl ester carboxylesterase